ncbi:hypothetical protein LSAT2_024152 [Lamellibrachia satsuma]|nr:hypothetical protein LSAT2_024152 [Lamellibrachia satsuma]
MNGEWRMNGGGDERRTENECPHVLAEMSKTSDKQLPEAPSRPDASHNLSPRSITRAPPAEVVKTITATTIVIPVNDDTESHVSTQPDAQLMPQQRQNTAGGSVTDASSTGRSAGDSTAGIGGRSAIAPPLMATMQEFPLDYRQMLTGRIADLPLLADDNVIYVYHIAAFAGMIIGVVGMLIGVVGMIIGVVGMVIGVVGMVIADDNVHG